MKKRTLEDFVKDCLSHGRTPEDIRAVALNIHWKGVHQEAYALAKKLKKAKEK